MNFSTVEDSLDFVSLSGLDIIEFGVYSGKSLITIIEGLKKRNIGINQITGFDSFEGLPSEAEGVFQNPEWQKGVFNAQEWYNVQTPELVMNIIYNKLLWLHQKTVLIKGWFGNTLNEETIKENKISNVSYVHIDCDQFIGANQALKFCFKNHLPVKGTIFRYDDWYSTPENGGEKLAHSLNSSKFNISWERLTENVFMVKSYRGTE